MPINTGDNLFGVAKWIVDPTLGSGTHTTIGAAITSASSGDTIFIRPGTYSENLTLKAGVNLTSFPCDPLTPNVNIIGKASFSAAGTVTISGVQLQTNSDFVVSITGSAASIVNLVNCFINCSNNTGLNTSSSNAASILNLYSCNGNLATTGIGLFAFTGSGTVNLFYGNFTNTGSSTTQSTSSAGNLNLVYTTMNSPITTSGTCVIAFNYANIATSVLGVTPLIINGTSGGSGGSINYTELASGGAPGLVITTFLRARKVDIFSSNSNAINGSGTLNYDDISFSSSSSTINAGLTLQPLVLTTGTLILGTQVQILSGSGSPNGSVTAPQGSMYLRTDGSGPTTRAYINTNGGTAWTSITTAG